MQIGSKEAAQPFLQPSSSVALLQAQHVRASPPPPPSLNVASVSPTAADQLARATAELEALKAALHAAEVAETAAARAGAGAA